MLASWFLKGHIKWEVTNPSSSEELDSTAEGMGQPKEEFQMLS